MLSPLCMLLGAPVSQCSGLTCEFLSAWRVDLVPAGYGYDRSLLHVADLCGRYLAGQAHVEMHSILIVNQRRALLKTGCGKCASGSEMPSSGNLLNISRNWFAQQGTAMDASRENMITLGTLGTWCTVSFRAQNLWTEEFGGNPSCGRESPSTPL